MRSPWTIPLAIIFGGCVIAGALYLSLPKGETATLSLVTPLSPEDHILGNPAAPIIVITYSDFECSYCKTFHEAMNQIIANAGARGEVAWVFRHFPLSEIHENARSHAYAAECAGSGNNALFWEFADELFRAQPTTPASYGTLAARAGLRGTAFASCVAEQDQALLARIDANRENALALGAEGTPFSVVLVSGAPVEVMKGGYSYAAIDALLKELK